MAVQFAAGICLALISGGTSARAQGARADAAAHRADPVVHRVAIVVAGVVNVDEAEALALSGQLAKALQARLELRAIAGREVAAMLPPQGGPCAVACVADTGCMRGLVARLQVDELLLLNVTRIGAHVRIEVARFRANDARAVSLAPIEAERDLAAAMAAAAPLLVPSARLRAATTSRGRSALRPLTLVLATTSGLSLAIAGGFGIAAWKEYRNLGDHCRDRVCSEGSFDSLRRRRLTADIALGTGLLAGSAALLLWLRGGEEQGQMLTVGPGEIGATWVSVF